MRSPGLLLTLSVAALNVIVQSYLLPVDVKGTDSSLIRNLTYVLKPVLATKSAQWSNAGVVMGFRHRNDTLTMAAGYNDHVANISTTVDDKFLFGSSTKMVTGTAVLQLVERGVLTLDEPMAPHVDQFLLGALPKTNYSWRSLEDLFGPKVNNVTVRHLLHMYSGLPDYDNGDLRGYQNQYPNRDIGPLAILNMCPKTFTCDPGTCGEYSSTNFVILGLLLAKYANTTSWDAYHQNEVFPPLAATHFKNTIFPLHGPCRDYPGVAHGYQQSPGKFDVYNISCLGGWTCGNLAAPVQDVADFCYDLYGPKEVLVKSTTKWEMLKFAYLSSGNFPAWYGLGTMMLRASNASGYYAVNFVGHGGATYGFYSMSGYHLELDFSLSVGINMETSVFQENLDDIFNTLYAYITGMMQSR